MKIQQILVLELILGTVLHAAAAEPKKNNIRIDPPPTEDMLAHTSGHSDAVLSDLTAFQPEVPLGPQDVLKPYELAVNMVAKKTSSDFAVIVQAQKANQISREQAGYLLQ